MLFVQLIWKNLRERLLRSLLTAAGLAIAVAAIATLWNTAWGYAESSRKFYAARGVDIVVVRAGVSNRLTSRLQANIAGRLTSVPGVVRADGVLTEMVSLGDANLLGVPLRGYASDNQSLERLQIGSGRRLAAGDHDTVLLGNAIAESLGKHEGQQVEIEGKPFRVAGVYLAENPYDANSIVAPLADVQQLMDRPGIISELQVQVAPTIRDDAALGEVCRAIEALRDDMQQPLGLRAQPTHRYVSTATESRLGNAMAWATTAIVITLSLLGMINTMLMSVLERTRELGILRAVGWTRARIVRLILGESFMISLSGAVVGTSIAWLLIRILSHWERTSLLVPARFSLSAVALGIAAAVGTGIVGSLYPALRAAGVPPVESLRYE